MYIFTSLCPPSHPSTRLLPSPPLPITLLTLSPPHPPLLLPVCGFCGLRSECLPSMGGIVSLSSIMASTEDQSLSELIFPPSLTKDYQSSISIDRSDETYLTRLLTCHCSRGLLPHPCKSTGLFSYIYFFNHLKPPEILSFYGVK
jgi:hypothetical protein